MKKILHSGQFLDYDGNIIKITFYQEKHLWVSNANLRAGFFGGVIEFELWSDAGIPAIRDHDYGWISDPTPKGSYVNSDGITVYKYSITVSKNPVVNSSRSAELVVYVEANTDLNGYEGELTRTITITQGR